MDGWIKACGKGQRRCCTALRFGINTRENFNISFPDEEKSPEEEIELKAKSQNCGPWKTCMVDGVSSAFQA